MTKSTPSNKTREATGGFKLLPLLVIPVLCCSLPLLLAGIGAFGIAALGGSLAALVIGGVLVGAVVVRYRHRCASTGESASPPTDLNRDPCP